MTMTETLYDLLTQAHFNLIKAYDLVPKLLADESEGENLLTADDLQSLRNITTENALLAKDLESDIDALLNDVPEDPVELALTRVHDALVMLKDETRVCTRRDALDDALSIVRGMMHEHGYETFAYTGSTGDVRELAAQAEQEARPDVLALREDRRRSDTQAAPRVEQARDPAADAAQRTSPGTGREQATGREPASDEAVIRCNICNGVMTVEMSGSIIMSCPHCFMNGL